MLPVCQRAKVHISLFESHVLCKAGPAGPSISVWPRQVVKRPDLDTNLIQASKNGSTSIQSDPLESKPTLQTELRETFQAFQASPWASKLGGFEVQLANKAKCTTKKHAVRPTQQAGEALKGFTDLRESIVKRTKGLSIVQKQAKSDAQAEREVTQESAEQDADAALKENATFILRFQHEAAKRLKDVKKAEDAVYEALLRFGTNIRNFLRNALHVIYTTLARLMQDSEGTGKQWDDFKSSFDIGSKTDDIAKDLERYPDLRGTIEKLVLEKVEYGTFWCRYYFLRHKVEAQEERRKEMLKASAASMEEVAWDEDSDPDESPHTPQIRDSDAATAQTPNMKGLPPLNSDHLKPEGRRSHDEKSVADSDSSYDLVSGQREATLKSAKENKDESDDDWE